METAFLYDARRRAWTLKQGDQVASTDALRQLSALFVRSELSDNHHDELINATADEADFHSRTADTAPIPVSSAAVTIGTNVVDVDALNDTDTDRGENMYRAATVPMRTQRVGGLSLRDAVVLCYRDVSDDNAMYSRTAATSCADDAAPPSPAGELLSVATEDSRVFLRRSGLTVVPHNGHDPALHVWRTDNTKDTDNKLEAEDNTAAGHSSRAGAFFEWSDSAPSSKNEPSTRPSSAIPTTVYSGRWRQEASVLLEHARGTLHRVRPRRGSFISSITSSSPVGSHGSASRTTFGHCQADYVALSTNSVTLVQSRDYGADLAAVQHTIFACELRANAICMDDWGPHSTLVGFSDGTLRVVDWRMPTKGCSLHTSDGDAAGDVDRYVALCTHVPQPPWLKRSGRSGAGAASVAGVLSCCSFEDNFRVVCGLGDASGAVVVADLRRPNTGDRPGRRRTHAERLAAQHLFPETSGQSPTGRAVMDIQQNPSCFGQIGFVDKMGTTVLTSLAALDGGASHCAATAVKRCRTIERGGGAYSSITLNTTSRPRLPPPPSPQMIAERLATLSGTVSRLDALSIVSQSIRGGPDRVFPEEANALREWSHRPVVAHLSPRCAFSDDGRHFAHTSAGGGAVAATVRWAGAQSAALMGRPSLLYSPGKAATHLQLVPNTASGHTALVPSPFIAVSCIDGIACFDTGDGHTLVMPME